MIVTASLVPTNVDGAEKPDIETNKYIGNMQICVDHTTVAGPVEAVNVCF